MWGHVRQDSRPVILAASDDWTMRVDQMRYDLGEGIMMAQQRCDADTAFDILRRPSQNRKSKLREFAAEIVTAVSGKSPEPGSFQPPSPGPN